MKWLLNLYKKWDTTNKLFFWLTIIGILLPLVLPIFPNSTNDINYTISITNSTLSKSPVVLGNNNSFVFNDEQDHLARPELYPIEFGLNNTLQISDLGKGDLFNVKVRFPDFQEAFLEIYGVGNQKLAQFGEKFMSIIRHHKNTFSL